MAHKVLISLFANNRQIL